MFLDHLGVRVLGLEGDGPEVEEEHLLGKGGGGGVLAGLRAAAWATGKQRIGCDSLHTNAVKLVRLKNGINWGLGVLIRLAPNHRGPQSLPTHLIANAGATADRQPREAVAGHAHPERRGAPSGPEGRRARQDQPRMPLPPKLPEGPEGDPDAALRDPNSAGIPSVLAADVHHSCGLETEDTSRHGLWHCEALFEKRKPLPCET
jgi:hypothetical protein